MRNANDITKTTAHSQQAELEAAFGGQPRQVDNASLLARIAELEEQLAHEQDAHESTINALNAERSAHEATAAALAAKAE